MTLEETIKRYKKHSECIQQTLITKMEAMNVYELLRELKIHREIHDVLLQTLVDFDIDMCCEDLADNEEELKICEENCTNNSKGCWVRWAKLKAREVNADE